MASTPKKNKPAKSTDARAAEKKAAKAVKAAHEAESRAVAAVREGEKAAQVAAKAAELARKTDKKSDRKKAEKAAKAARTAYKKAEKWVAEAADKSAKAAKRAAEVAKDDVKARNVKTKSKAKAKSSPKKSAKKKTRKAAATAKKKTAVKKGARRPAAKKTAKAKTAKKAKKGAVKKGAKKATKKSVKKAVKKTAKKTTSSKAKAKTKAVKKTRARKTTAPKSKATKATASKSKAKAPAPARKPQAAAKPRVDAKPDNKPKAAPVARTAAPQLSAAPPAVKPAPKPAKPKADKPKTEKPATGLVGAVASVVESVVERVTELVADVKPATRPAAATPKAPKASDDKLRYYITTAISYPNGPPHIGHAYEVIATDAIARFKRLDGYDVMFLTGTDEHGSKIQQTAAKEGLTAKELLDRNVPRFKAMAERLNCSNDDFIRTTEPRHYKSSAAIWERMEKNGDIYLDRYAGWYSVRDERYYAEDETHVNEHKVRLSTETGTPVEWVEEESYFFRLSAYEKKLLDLYDSDPSYVMPKERLNEVASFVRGGLKDLSISRTTFDWGIPVPGNPKHIMYVWVDALTNYITAAGFPDTDSDKFKRYWPADLHVIGKDIVKFHAVYWPAFLMSAGIEIPRRIYSHGFLFNRGEKMSKSVGNVIDPFSMADAYGVDQMRYFFLREVPFGQDGSYSHDAIVARINADLANDLGNLAQRSLTMVGKQLGGVLPVPGEFTANDMAILDMADAMLEKVREWMQTQALHQVLNTVWAVVAEANRYFAGEAPWALAKTDPPRQGTVLYVTAEVIRQVAILAQPFMPEASGKLLDLLAVPADSRTFAALAKRLPGGAQLPAPSPVFPRYVEPAGETK